MAYSLYRLEFSTGLHIGGDAGGPSLDDGRMTIHSDTLFAALGCESAAAGKIAQLYEAFAGGALAMSDALPYSGEEYYLPKPVLYTGNVRREGSPTRRKALKSIEYIPLCRLDEYLGGLAGGEIDPEQYRSAFGSLVTVTRVASRGNAQPLPYNVAYWRFSAGCGLYVIVRWEDEASLALFEAALAALGLSGVGGKQSSGLGKFEAAVCPMPPRLTEMLTDTGAPYQMLLGTGLPADAALDAALAGGWYQVVRRGGFVRSAHYADRPRKKRTLYLLAPGSCLRERFDGGMFDVSEGGAHPVWRCGKTLFGGVRL